MVMQLFIGLILIAAASLLVTQGKRRKFWSVLLLGFLCLISWFFIQGLSDNTSGFIYQWLPYKQLKADFNISASLRVKNMLLPLIYLLAVIVFLNIISVREYYSLNVSVLNLLGFTALILLVSSHDFFQMLFASAVLSIICYYVPDIPLLRRKLLVYNFISEMAGFIALAIVYSSVDSISLNRLQDYITHGNHKDFVTFLLLVAVGCKCGLFMLNDHYNSLKDMSFNRLNGILVLSVPFAGLVWVSKINVLLSVSNVVAYLVCFWCVITFLVSGWLALIKNNVNQKIISLAQMVYAIMFFMVYKNAEKLYTVVPIALAIILLVSVMVYTLAASANSQDSEKTKWLRIFVSFCTFTAVIGLWQVIGLKGYMTTVMIVYLIVLAMITNIFNVCSDLKFADGDSFSVQQNTIYNVAVITAAAIICFFTGENMLSQKYYILAFIPILMAFVPLKRICSIGEMDIWKYKLAETFYNNIIIVPLKLFGRVLWLAVDFIFVEKGVVNTASSYSGSLVEHLRILQSGTWRALIFWLLLGCTLLAVYAGVCMYE